MFFLFLMNIMMFDVYCPFLIQIPVDNSSKTNRQEVGSSIIGEEDSGGFGE